MQTEMFFYLFLFAKKFSIYYYLINMKRFLFLLSLIAAVTTGVKAQKPEIIKLWGSKGAPTDNGLAGQETKEGNGYKNVAEAELWCYPAKKANGKAIVCCPGGGYTHLAFAHEGTDMAQWFNNQGITFCVLKYRMPNQHNGVPLEDVKQALKVVRDHERDWGVDKRKVGIMGSSAGGHLASTAATHLSSAEGPNFQVLLYPVISMDQSITHRGSRENLIGKNPTEMVVKGFSNELCVSETTPKAFIVFSADDKVVVPENTIRYAQALIAHKVPCTIHMYPIGGHGWGYRDSFTYKREWTGELEKWLLEMDR